MTSRILLTAAARLDLTSMWAFIADDSETAATRLIRRLREAAELLAVNPMAGRTRDDLRPELRSFPVGSYVLFYRLHPDGIEIVRVLNGYLDLSAVSFN